KKTYEEIWNNKNEYLLVSGISDGLMKVINSVHQRKVKQDNTPIKITDKFNLYDYQKEAINSWVNNDYKGLLEMATGTGKTITALACQERLSSIIDTLVTFVVVPQLDLLSQLYEEILTLNINTIRCSSKHEEWESTHKITLKNHEDIKNIIIITTVQTFISKKMQRIISDYLEHDALLIADEVHGFGSQKTREHYEGIEGK